MGPLLAMRKALYSALVNDSALIALLGGTRIYASVPSATDPPYICFGLARVTLWNGGSQIGHKHYCVLDIWSLQGGDVEMLALADRINQIVLSGAVVPDGHHMLHCFIETVTAHPPRSDGWRQTALELAALTEQQVSVS